MTGLRSTAASLRDAMRAARFRAWAYHLDLELRRNGGRLVLDAPHGVTLDGAPTIKAVQRGEGDGTLTLRAGRGVSLGRNVQLEVWAGGTNVLDLANNSYVLDGVRLSLRSGTIALGPGANVRDYSMLKSQGRLLLGREVTVQFGSYLHCTEHVELRDVVGTGERVTIIDSEKRHDGTDTHFLRQPLRVEPVVLERNVFVAANAVITHGTRVGANSVVGAGAVLTGGEYPGSSVIAGAPAKVVKKLPGAPESPPSES